MGDKKKQERCLPTLINTKITSYCPLNIIFRGGGLLLSVVGKKSGFLVYSPNIGCMRKKKTLCHFKIKSVSPPPLNG